jgi:hypothetical protein
MDWMAGFVADGQWHHIAFTVNTGVLGNGGRLSVDGVLKDTQPWSSGRDPQPGPPTTTQEVRLGNESGTGIPFDGLLDEIAIWQNVLSQAQIQTNMHRGLTGAEANLLAYYRLRRKQRLHRFGHRAPSTEITMARGRHAAVCPFRRVAF